MDCSLPGSSIHGIFQARVLEWGAIAFSIRGYYQSLKGVVVVHMLTWKNIPFIFSGEKSPVNSPLPSPPTLLPPLLLLRLRQSGSPQRRRLSWACVLCPSQVRVAQVFGERGRCDLSPLPPLLPGFLGVQLAPLLRRMVPVHNPKKS